MFHLLMTETFKGFLDSIREGVGYITIEIDEETYYGEYDAGAFIEAGVYENRRFYLHYNHLTSDISFTAIPDKEITPEVRERIDAMLDAAFGDNDPQND